MSLCFLNKQKNLGVVIFAVVSFSGARGLNTGRVCSTVVVAMHPRIPQPRVHRGGLSDGVEKQEGMVLKFACVLNEVAGRFGGNPTGRNGTRHVIHQITAVACRKAPFQGRLDSLLAHHVHKNRDKRYSV